MASFVGELETLSGGWGNKEIDVQMKIVLLSKVRLDSEELNFFFLLAHGCSHSRAGATSKVHP